MMKPVILSDRVRPNSEVPTWVHTEILAMETTIEEQAREIEQLMETFVRVADFLGIDTEAARKAPGKPSDVFIAALKAQLPELRTVVTDALMGMIAAVTSTTPPADQPPPPFIQSAIDRAVDRIARLNASRVPELAGHFVQPYLDRPEVIERVDDSCSSDPDVFPLYRFAAPSPAPVDTEARKNDE